MKKLLKPACIGFYILMLLFFFILGLYFAAITDAAKNQGLAGGAIVLGYGVMFAGIGFVGSFFIAYFMNLKYIKIINWVLLVIILATWGYKFYQFQQRDKDQPDIEKELKPKPVSTQAEPVSALLNFRMKPKRIAIDNMNQETSAGMGFFAPEIFGVKALYFYGNPNFEKSIIEHSPTDSISFQEIPAGIPDIATAPAYLVPAHMKLDYSILYFRIKSLTDDFVEIEVNAQTGQTTFVDKRAGKTLLWPDFLLMVNSVEFPEGSKGMVHLKWLESSSVVSEEFDFMKPLRIRGDWMEVILLGDGFESRGKGWVRWKKDGQLLIEYNLLS